MNKPVLVALLVLVGNIFSSAFCSQDNPFETGFESIQNTPEGHDELSKSGQPSDIAPTRKDTLGLVYQVHVVGEVRQPGTLRVTASTRVSEALKMAGGPRERGSNRYVELRRSKGNVRRIDLSAFTTRGDLNANPYLSDNDVIFVPLKTGAIDIRGAVTRPGTYELDQKSTLWEVIQLAGGPSLGADKKQPITVARIEDAKQRLINLASTDERALKEFEVQPSDVVVIPHVLLANNKFDYQLARLPGEEALFLPSQEQRVFVIGSVGRPGAYPFNPNARLENYMALAGGATRLAIVDKVYLLGPSGTKRTELNPINPGDTIVVPERYLPPETWVQLFLGIATSLATIGSLTTAIILQTR